MSGHAQNSTGFPKKITGHALVVGVSGHARGEPPNEMEPRTTSWFTLTSSGWTVVALDWSQSMRSCVLICVPRPVAVLIHQCLGVVLRWWRTYVVMKTSCACWGSADATLILAWPCDNAELVMCVTSGPFSSLGTQGLSTRNLVRAKKRLGGGGEGEEEGREGYMGNSSNTSKTCTKLANTGGLEGMTATIFDNHNCRDFDKDREWTDVLLLGEASEWCRPPKKTRGGGGTLALRNCERPKQEMRSETMAEEIDFVSKKCESLAITLVGFFSSLPMGGNKAHPR